MQDALALFGCSAVAVAVAVVAVVVVLVAVAVAQGQNPLVQNAGYASSLQHWLFDDPLDNFLCVGIGLCKSQNKWVLFYLALTAWPE